MSVPRELFGPFYGRNQYLKKKSHALVIWDSGFYNFSGTAQSIWPMRLVGYAMRLDIWREKVRETMSPTHWVLCQGSQFNRSQPIITATIAIGVISIHSCGNEVQQTLSIPMNLCFCETFVTNQETFSTSKFSGRMFMLLSWTN